MIRYDLIVKKVDGCASARVEKHELGSFVKYVDVMEHIAELEKERFTFKKIISNPAMTDYDKYVHIHDMLKEQE
tara:strand:- start:2795 stop:3016 length:222 start_codon:yes stop_codon:yes gene_type:complete